MRHYSFLFLNTFEFVGLFSSYTISHIMKNDLRDVSDKVFYILYSISPHSHKFSMCLEINIAFTFCIAILSLGRIDLVCEQAET